MDDEPSSTPAGGASRRWSDAGTLAILATFVLLLFRSLAFEGRFLYDRDVQLIWHPKAEAFARVVRSGSWPLWNPFSAFGAPLLGVPTNQVLYPPTWLLLVLTPWRYYSLYVLGHVFLWGAGLYFLARTLGASRSAALAGALLGATAGPLLSVVDIWNHLAGAAWMPWIVLAGDRALASGRLRHVSLWGAALAMTMLAGSPEPALLAVVANGALALRRVGWPPRLDVIGRMLATASAAGLVALALSAAQWMPALEQARRSTRTEMPAAGRAEWSIHPAGLLESVLPVRPDQLPLKPDLRVKLYTAPERPLMRSIYLGLPAIALVAAALVGRARSEARALLGALLVGVLIAVGDHTPLFDLTLTVLPPLRAFRHPAKALLLVAMCWAVLASLGYDAWGRRASEAWGQRAKAVVVTMLAVASALVLALAVVVHRSPAAIAAVFLVPGASGRASAILTPVALSLAATGVAIVAALAVAAAPTGWRVAAHAPAVLALLAVADCLYANRGLNPTVPEGFFTEVPPILDQLRVSDGSRLYVFDYWVPGMSERFLGHRGSYMVPGSADVWPVPWLRALAMRQYVQPAQQALWGLEVGYESDLGDLQPTYVDGLTRLLWFAHGTPKLADHLLRLGAISRVVALHTTGFEGLQHQAELSSLFVEPIHVFRVPDPLPRAYAVSGVRTPRGHEDIAEALFGLDLRREIVVTEGAEPHPPSPSFSGACRVVELRPNRIRLEVELNEAGYVVLVDAYDPGWQARIDDQPAAVLRANVAFRAVPTPAGRHVVEMRYRPATLPWGIGITALAIAGVAVSLLPKQLSEAYRIRRA